MPIATPITAAQAYSSQPSHDQVAAGMDCRAKDTPTDEVTLTIQGRWVVISDLRGCAAPQRQPGLGHPGLWKVVQDDAGPQRVFEIPRWAVDDPATDDSLASTGETLMQRLVDWALETRQGALPPDWVMPDAALVESWMPGGGLTVQAGGIARQGELLLRPDVWALRMPIVPRIAPDLPAPRLRALEQLAAETQRSWAMVRLSFTGDPDPSALVAEVNFTGAPHVESLFLAGLDVLRHVTRQVQETADVLSNASVEIACLAGSGATNKTHPERSKPI